MNAVELISRLLIEHGPLSREDVVERLRDAGVTDPETVMRDNLNEMVCPIGQLVDERWCWLPEVLSGRVLTHRVTSEEITHDLLVKDADLDAIADLLHHEEYQQLADGSPVSLVVAGYDDDLLAERGIPEDAVDAEVTLLLPAGTLSALAVAEGDLVGLRLTDAGLAVERVTDVESGADIGDRLLAVMSSDEPTNVASAVWTMCVDDPAAFTRPVAPLNEIIADRGLVQSAGSVAPAGFDVDQWRVRIDCERLVLRYEVRASEAVAVRALTGLYWHMAEVLLAEEDSDEATYDGVQVTPELAAVLSDPFLAAVLWTETIELGGPAAAMGWFAESLEATVPRRAKVAYRWLRALALEQMGDVAPAERELLNAETMDPDWEPVLLDLARFASDRGDAERGLALLSRGGADEDHPIRQLLERHRSTPRSDVGRNDACWCGSGRKYKKCHLGREGLSLDERVQWLYLKAGEHVMGTAWRTLLEDVAEQRAAYASDDDEADALALDPLVMDATLFEGGGFEDFVAKRGVLLPDDEHELAEQWLLIDRSVFEVDEVRAGLSVTVRDVRAGDVHEVTERTASRYLKPGQLICTRVAPAGESLQFFGGVEPVALQHRAPLVELLDSEPDADELVAFLTLRFAPPTIVNTDGHDLMQCDARLRVGADIAAALDDAFERVRDHEWYDSAELEGETRIRAIIVLDGDTLTVSTNSEERMDETLATVARIDPSAEVVADERTGIDELGEAAPPGETDPAVAAALDEYIRMRETNWLDESIPALEGLTPREAADDPTRRGDLIRLLDSFPTTEGGMSAARLRAALNLAGDNS